MSVWANRMVRSPLLVLLALAGCVSAPPTPDTRPVPPQPREIVRIASQRFTAPAVSAVMLEVRGPREADLTTVEEIRELTRQMTTLSVGVSGIAIAEAVMMPGFFSGTLVAGGLILAPLAIGLNSAEKKQHAAITAALKESELLDYTREALEKRLPERAADTRLSVIMLAYGLVPKNENRFDSLCLSLVAHLVVQAGENVLFRDTVHIEPYRRSDDVPPPICATMEAFADAEGASLRRAVRDYAQILAAIVRHRLPALPWSP